MEKDRTNNQDIDNISEKQGFLLWLKENKTSLLLFGVSTTAIIAVALGLKNKAAIAELWKTLKRTIEKGNMYSAKWFEKSSLEELREAREVIHNAYLNPELDLDKRSRYWELLGVFNKYIGEKEWNGEPYGFPVTKNWYLTSDD